MLDFWSTARSAPSDGRTACRSGRRSSTTAISPRSPPPTATSTPLSRSESFSGWASPAPLARPDAPRRGGDGRSPLRSAPCRFAPRGGGTFGRFGRFGRDVDRPKSVPRAACPPAFPSTVPPREGVAVGAGQKSSTNLLHNCCIRPHRGYGRFFSCTRITRETPSMSSCSDQPRLPARPRVLPDAFVLPEIPQERRE